MSAGVVVGPEFHLFEKLLNIMWQISVFVVFHFFSKSKVAT